MDESKISKKKLDVAQSTRDGGGVELGGEYEGPLTEYPRCQGGRAQVCQDSQGEIRSDRL